MAEPDTIHAGLAAGYHCAATAGETLACYWPDCGCVIDTAAPLLTAAIAVARSEAAASTPAPGEPEDHAHEPWPEMEALRAVLDVVRPGWRV